METSDILLLHPEDEAGENIYTFVGMYMQVYAQYVKVSRAITEHITGDIDHDKRLGNIASFTEAPLEKWLHQADEFLPEWFDSKLLNYPDDAGRALAELKVSRERLQAAGELADVAEMLQGLIVKWTYTDSDGHSFITDDLGEVLTASQHLQTALEKWEKQS